MASLLTEQALQSKEMAFIRAIVLHHLDPAQPMPPPAALDWEKLYELLIVNRLAGLCYHWGQADPDLWPPPLAHKLQQLHYNALLYGDQFAEHVKIVLSALHNAGIPVVVFKGWAMLANLYAMDYSLRGFDDIDLLVRPEDAARSQALLQAIGYLGQKAEVWPGHHQRYRNSRAFISRHNLGPYQQRFVLGLHWGLLDTPYFDRFIEINPIFARSAPLEILGLPARQLALEDYLPYFCGHLALHHEYDPALYRYYEILRLIRASEPPVDWATVTQRAIAWRVALPTHKILQQIEKLLPGTIPGAVLQALGSYQPGRYERQLHDWIVRQRDNPTLRATLILLTTPNWLRKLQFIAEVALPAPAYMRQRYGQAPGGFTPWLYFRRYRNFLANLRHLAGR